MQGQANKFTAFSMVANDAVQVMSTAIEDGFASTLTVAGSASVLIINVKTVGKGYYSMAYHCLMNNDETSQDFSLPFPAYELQSILGGIVNDVYPVAIHG